MKLTNRDRILWASEPNVGTPSDAVAATLTTPTADITYQQVRSLEIKRDVAVVETARVRGSASGVKHGVVAERCSVTMEIPFLAWAGVGEPPHYGPMMKAMGMKEVIGASDVQYSPSTTQQSAATIYQYQRNAEDDNCRLQIATGVRGSAPLNIALGAEPFWAFTGTGNYKSLGEPKAFFDTVTGGLKLQADGTTPVPVRTTGEESYADQAPMLCKCMEITVGGDTWQISELEMDLGWSLDEIESVNGCSKRVKALLTRGDRISLSFNLVDYTDADLTKILGYLDNGNEITLSIALGNSDGKITITAPKMQIGNPEDGAAGNVRTYSIPGFLNGDWSSLRADNDFTIKYEAATP